MLVREQTTKIQIVGTDPCSSEIIQPIFIGAGRAQIPYNSPLINPDPLDFLFRRMPFPLGFPTSDLFLPSLPPSVVLLFLTLLSLPLSCGSLYLIISSFIIFTTPYTTIAKMPKKFNHHYVLL